MHSCETLVVIGHGTPSFIMNIIQEIVELYHGEYFEYQTKVFHTPEGKLETQPQKGKIIVDGTNFSLKKVENIGVKFNSRATNKIFHEPIRILLHLGTAYNSKLAIYPKSIFQKVMDYFKIFKKSNDPFGIRKEYIFNGNKALIEELTNHSGFSEILSKKKIFITINEKYPSIIMLIPQNGLSDKEEFENYIIILKAIEQKLNNY